MPIYHFIMVAVVIVSIGVNPVFISDWSTGVASLNLYD
jgi:hypothetical protein